MHARLDIDPAAATLLTDWYRPADAALRAFAAEMGDDGQRPTLARALRRGHHDRCRELRRLPGDENVDAPYLYAGPHGGPPARDNFWNIEFGAVRTLAEVGSPADALMFFRQGRSFLVIAAENPAAGGRR